MEAFRFVNISELYSETTSLCVLPVMAMFKQNVSWALVFKKMF